MTREGRDLRRLDVAFHIAMLVGMSPDRLDELQREMREAAT